MTVAEKSALVPFKTALNAANKIRKELPPQWSVVLNLKNSIIVSWNPLNTDEWYRDHDTDVPLPLVSYTVKMWNNDAGVLVYAIEHKWNGESTDYDSFQVMERNRWVPELLEMLGQVVEHTIVRHLPTKTLGV